MSISILPDEKSFKIMETSQYRKFIKWLIDNSINFHPDDDFNTYIFSHGKKCFSKEVAEKININFDLAKKVFTDNHLYKIIRQEQRKIKFYV